MVAYERQGSSRIRVPAHNAFKMLEEDGQANAEWLRFFQLISGPPQPIQALHPPIGGGVYAFTANTPGTLWVPSSSGVSTITLLRGRPPAGGTPYSPTIIAPTGVPTPVGGGGPGTPYIPTNAFIDYTANQNTSPVLNVINTNGVGDTAQENNSGAAGIQQWQVYVSTANAMRATGNGKFFWRCKCLVNNSASRLGLAKAQFPYNGNELGSDPSNFGFASNGQIAAGGGGLGYTTHPAAVSVNDIIEFAYNSFTHMVWVRNFTQSPSWYGANAVGDPVAGTNGIDLSSVIVSWPQDLYASGNFTGTFGDVTSEWNFLFNDVTNLPSGYTLAPGWSTAATSYNYTYSQVPASSGAAQGKGTLIQLPQMSGPIPLATGDTIYIYYTSPPGIYWVPSTGA